MGYFSVLKKSLYSQCSEACVLILDEIYKIKINRI